MSFPHDTPTSSEMVHPEAPASEPQETHADAQIHRALPALKDLALAAVVMMPTLHAQAHLLASWGGGASWTASA